ncbi:ArsR family transcriptional regulator [Halococcus sp. IIIV-5B]|uniref:transcriptional regulator FilR1 domain-containing protein n=1 Tax=Halococcus sp. IIIV-5B TaxID=2321230 RepID=UPI000E741560|nr:ArsR family transcriptional regulator [Halococcus sp. IIIV-5B]RJT04684.1 ArsR family transcriptional regulator [Halococcus sp. IIIV-5B]
MRQVTNPLTGEQFDVQNGINTLVDSDRLDVLVAANELRQPTTPQQIANHIDKTRQSVSDHLQTLRKHGLITRHESGIERTAGGVLLAEYADECLENLSRDQLSYLTRSNNGVNHRMSTLATICEGEYRTSDLSDAISTTPSRSTVGRITENFIEFGWSTEDASVHRPTPKAKEVLLAYDELANAVEQIVAKANWLQRLPPKDAAGLPVPALKNASVVASDSNRPDRVLWNALKLCDVNISQFRCVSSIYNPVLFEVYKQVLESGVDSESVLDWSTYQEIEEKEEVDYAADASQYENYEPRYLDFVHTLGVGLYDDRKAAVGAYNELGDGQHIAMIITSDDELVTWATTLYEEYWDLAIHALDDPEKQSSSRNSGSN